MFSRRSSSFFRIISYRDVRTSVAHKKIVNRSILKCGGKGGVKQMRFTYIFATVAVDESDLSLVLWVLEDCANELVHGSNS